MMANTISDWGRGKELREVDPSKAKLAQNHQTYRQEASTVGSQLAATRIQNFYI